VVSAKGHLDRTRRGGLKENNSTAPFADQHREIFDALVDRELRRVRDTMRKHLRAVFEDVERIRQRSPELFAAETARCRAVGRTPSPSSMPLQICGRTFVLARIRHEVPTLHRP
jgi:hypothetical protein